MFSEDRHVLASALDRADQAVMLARCWFVDLIYGPEPLTPADEKRDADRKELEGLPVIDFGAFMTHANEEPNTGLDRS